MELEITAVIEDEISVIAEIEATLLSEPVIITDTNGVELGTALGGETFIVANSVIKRSDLTTIASVPAEANRTIADTEVRNSAGTLLASVMAESADVTISDVTHTDSDGLPVILPDHVAFVSTLCPVHAFNQRSLDYFALMSVQPSAQEKLWLDEFITDCLTDQRIGGGGSNFDEFDYLRLAFIHDSQSSLLNCVKNAHHATAVNSPVFTANSGFLFSGTNYLLSNYNPATQAVKYLKDAAMLHAYATTNTLAGVGALMGNTSAANSIMYLDNASNFYGYINSASGVTDGVYKKLGYFKGERSSATSVTLYEKDYPFKTAAGPSGALQSLDFYEGARNNGSAGAYYKGRIHVFGASSNLVSSIFYVRLLTLLNRYGITMP